MTAAPDDKASFAPATTAGPSATAVSYRDGRRARYLQEQVRELREEGEDNETILELIQIQNVKYCTPPLSRPTIVGMVYPELGDEGDNKLSKSVWRKLDDWNQRNPKWLWENRIPVGELSLLVGDPATFKTTIAIAIAAALTSGGKWPEGEGTAALGAVLWIGISESAPDYVILPRLRAAGGEAAAMAVHWETIANNGAKRQFAIKLDIEDLRQKIRAARGVRDIRALFIDPMPEFLGDVDSWKDDQVRSVLAPLTNLAKEESIAVIGVMHPRKSTDAQRVLTNITGSAAYGWIARAVMFTKQLLDAAGKETGEYALLWEKASLSRTHPTGLKYRAVDCPVQAVNDGDEDIVSAPIIEWLGTTDLRLRELLSPLGRKTSAKDQAIEWLEDRLRDGPVEAAVVLDEGMARGFTTGTLSRARKDLGVESKPDGVGGKWMMSLHDPVF